MIKNKNNHFSKMEMQIAKQILSFFDEYKGLFVEFSNQKSKKNNIKKIYEFINYTLRPRLNFNLNSNDYIKIYRGISAETKEQLISYVEQFLNGEPFFGGRHLYMEPEFIL